MFYKSIGGFSKIEYKMVSPIPKEFIRNGTLERKIFPLESGKYDAVIGLKNHELKLFDKYVIHTYIQ